MIPGPDGPLGVRIYAPDAAAPLPVLVYFHGGGWVLGNLDTSDAQCRSLTNAIGCVTVSVDYRLAPEARFPAAVEDCYAATRWVADNASELGCDSKRVAVGGTSAGANLAAVVPLMARDRGHPSLAYQVLVYPITDGSMDTSSYRENAEGYFLTAGAMAWFWKHYINDDRDRSHPYAAPLNAADLSGLPPALVITAEYDPLRDEGEAYARENARGGSTSHLHPLRRDHPQLRKHGAESGSRKKSLRSDRGGAQGRVLALALITLSQIQLWEMLFHSPSPTFCCGRGQGEGSDAVRAPHSAATAGAFQPGTAGGTQACPTWKRTQPPHRHHRSYSTARRA